MESIMLGVIAIAALGMGIVYKVYQIFMGEEQQS